VTFPVSILGLEAHFVLEAAAYAIAFRAYVLLRRRIGDAVDDGRRWAIVTAAAVGAVVGSKLLWLAVDPAETARRWPELAFVLGGKTIVGALLGGLFAVEAMKLALRIRRPTGDLFAAPLCLGIAIGRVGCFLTGLDDQTHGVATSLPWGVDFGDGVPRHPTQLYEALFCAALGVALVRWTTRPHREGVVFRAFLASYLAWRLAIDFVKPGVRLGPLTGIQWACAAGLVYQAVVLVRARREASATHG
jgi:phosphatidylglycerol---prolipoprotein diacylglyceryl transferase